MLKSANLAKEIVVTVVNKIGVLADMSKILADHGINIEAVAGYADGDQAKIMLVTDDNLRAVDALKKKSYNSITEKEVIVLELENKAGALKNITGKLESEEIDIKYIYGTTCPIGCPASVVLSTSDNEKALVAFKAK
ncbi:MAG: ACT domain-containing protein [Candidatus Omnitrophica bacterium]|nr:ACT domain-containing protein [Candidatus Omnitrophota bacterium]